MLAEREPWLAAVMWAAMLLVAAASATRGFSANSTLAPTLEIETLSLDDLEYQTAIQERSPPLVSEDQRQQNTRRTMNTHPLYGIGSLCVESRRRACRTHC